MIHSMAENETQSVYLTIEVPKYASEWRRFEISLDALTHNPRVQKVASDASNEEQDGGSQHFQTSFHFTISRNGSLEDLDVIGPDCEQSLVKLKGLEECEQVDEHNCTELCWSADFNVRDNVTGLRSVWVEDYDNVTLSYDKAKLVEGMNSKRGLRSRVVASCCLDHVEVVATDVAGNEGVCRVGKVDNGSARLDNLSLKWFWMAIFVLSSCG